MSNLLTISRIRSRQTCAKKHDLEYEQGWRPVREQEFFGVGRLFHRALRAWWAAAAEGLDPFDTAIGALASGAEDEFRQVLVEEMLRAYDARWRGEADRYELVANEQVFQAPLINPETGGTSRTFLIAGAVDKIVRERATGKLLLVEHKTSSESIEDPVDPFWAKLAMDSQVSHYFLGAEALGFPVEGCLYDVAKKPGQKPFKATPPESRKYTKDGKLYAAQRERDETPEEFRARIRAALEENRDRFFQRREVARLESQLKDHLVDVWSIAGQIREDRRLGRAPRNTAACHAFGTCPYWDLCANGLHPEDHPDLYVRLEDVHPELVSEQKEQR